jgi:hypothetical protein
MAKLTRRKPKPKVTTPVSTGSRELLSPAHPGSGRPRHTFPRIRRTGMKFSFVPYLIYINFLNLVYIYVYIFCDLLISL